MTRSLTRARAAWLFYTLGVSSIAALCVPAARAQDAATEDAATQDADPVDDEAPTAGAGETHADDTQTGNGNEARPRVAVLLLAAAEVDPTVADALSETLIGAVAARGGVTLIGQAELGAQLGHDDVQLLDCVAAPTCLGRIGVELGLAEVVAGTLGQRSGGWVFNLNRLDVESGETRARVFREVEGDLGALADALSAAVPDLYAPPPTPPEPLPPPPPSSTLSVAGPPGAAVRVDGQLAGTIGAAPLRVEGLSPGEHSVETALPNGPWLRRVTLRAGDVLRLEPPPPPTLSDSVNPLVFVAGGVAVAAFGAGLGLGVHSQETLSLTFEQRMDGSVTRADAQRFYAAREREAIVADVLFGLAGAAAIAAVVALFFPEQTEVEVSAAGVGGRF